MDPISQGEVQPRDATRGLEIRPLELSHLAQIRAIAEKSFPVLWSEKDFSYFLTEPNRRALGAFVQDNLVGYFLGLLAQGDLDVVSIATKPDWRRKGIGQRLLRVSEEGEAVKRVYLEVEETNVAAIELYKKLGFAQYGARKKYYQGVRDAILMTKTRS